jgi:hypothetical protein
MTILTKEREMKKKHIEDALCCVFLNPNLPLG